MAKMTEYLKKNTDSESSKGNFSQLGSKVQVRLPKIELLTFDGDMLCW